MSDDYFSLNFPTERPFWDSDSNEDSFYPSTFSIDDPFYSTSKSTDDRFLLSIDHENQFEIPQHRRTPSSPAILYPSPLQPLSQISINKKHYRQRSLPTEQPFLLPDDHFFFAACFDTTLIIEPKALNFIPSSFWKEKAVTFGDLVRDFFQKKNHANSRFSHKLYNSEDIIAGAALSCTCWNPVD